MKTWIRAAAICCIAASFSFGQASYADIQTMKMWPRVPVKWLGTTDFSKTNYGYYQDATPNFSYTDGNFADWSKWKFAIYGGLTGKQVTAWATWGYPTPPPPSRLPNGTLSVPCEHTHIAYSIWLHYGYYSGGT